MTHFLTSHQMIPLTTTKMSNLKTTTKPDKPILRRRLKFWLLTSEVWKKGCWPRSSYWALLTWYYLRYWNLVGAKYADIGSYSRLLYFTYRKDRKTNTEEYCLPIKKILSSCIDKNNDSDCEILWNQMEIKGRRLLLIGTFYNPPHDDKDAVKGLEESLDKINNRKWWMS